MAAVASSEKHSVSISMEPSGEIRMVQEQSDLSVSSAWFRGCDEDLQPLECSVKHAARTYPLPAPGLTWTEESYDGNLLFEYFVESGDAVSFLVRVMNFGSETVNLQLRQEIAGLPLKGRLFAPTASEFYSLEKGEVAIGYRASGDASCIPLATLFDPDADIGVTLAAHIEMQLPGFRVEVTNADSPVLLQRRLLELRPDECRTVRHYFVSHAGCWRSGLEWLRDRFKKFFMLPENAPKDIYGCFTYSNVANKELCNQFNREGVKNLEIHFNYSHLGEYAPREEPWIPAIDDKWSAIKLTTDPAAPAEDAPYQEIKEYMSSVVESVGTTDRVREFIRRLKSLGIRTYCYFQPTECWEFYANAHFPEVILRHPDGRSALTWYDHVVMNCLPENRWGQYLCQQLEQVLDMYPEVDGIFMDQSAGDWENYAVCRITDKLAQIAEERGKWCYWNGPYIVELIEHAIGMLAEGSSCGDLIKYLTIGDKVCCGMGAPVEMLYQRNLINGLWPSAPSLQYEMQFRYTDELAHYIPLPEEVESLHERYIPLYELYHGKTWVLEPHALEVPKGVQGNVFQRPNGDYLVPVIIPESHGVMKNVEITVRVSGAERVKGVYARTPDAPGVQFDVKWTCNGNEVSITIPWLQHTCLLWLAGEEQKTDAVPQSPKIEQKDEKSSVKSVFSTYISVEAMLPTGSPHGELGGLKTTAPLPPIPVRKAWLNGHELITPHSRNYRSWHPLLSIGVPQNVMDFLKAENELVIEPAGPDDFIKVRNLQFHATFADGTSIHSEVVKDTYSSIEHSAAEGVIGSPIRIKIRIPDIG